jgi:precorrin-6B methylase 2
MEFVAHAVWGSCAPMLAGTYEAELESAIERLIARRPSRVVDVGAAEGYYAVGLARRLPEAMVYAYDVDADARRTCTEVATKNGVGARVRVLDRCSHSELRRLAGRDCIMVVDCEGCEAELLDPTCVPELTSTAMLVELHDFVDHTISSRVVERFSRSHRVELFDATVRDGTRVPALASMNRRNQRMR